MGTCRSASICLMTCILAASLACGTNSREKTPANEPDAASPVDAAVARTCPDLSVRAEQLSVAIAPARDHHVSFTHAVGAKTYLYVAGGAKDQFNSFFSDVQRAPIADDGQLGAFEPAGSLPGAIAGQGFTQVGDVLVIVGGARSSGLRDESYSVKIDGNGMVGTWKIGPTLPHHNMHPSVVAVGREVYVLGGLSHPSQVSDVVHMHVADDGTLEERPAQPDLPLARSHQAAWVDGKRIFMSGGLDRDPTMNPPSRDDVVFSDVDANGNLGPWTTAGTLAYSVSVHPAVPIGCDVLIAAGLSDVDGADEFLSSILLTRIGDDGLVRSSTVTTATLGLARGHVHQLPRYKNFYYAVGGRTNEGFKSTGVIDRITVDGAPKDD